MRIMRIMNSYIKRQHSQSNPMNSPTDEAQYKAIPADILHHVKTTLCQTHPEYESLIKELISLRSQLITRQANTSVSIVIIIDYHHH